MGGRNQPAGEIDWAELRPRPAGDWQEGEQGIELLVPRFGRGRFGRAMDRWMQPRPYRVHLDDLGTFVWRRIDGQRTVEQIADDMREAFGSAAEPVAERLTTFLRRLERGHFITYDLG